MKIIERWKIWFIISAIIIIPGIASLFAWGLNPGIDFSGGTLMEIQFTEKDNIDVNQVRDVFLEKGINNPQISLTDSKTFMSRSHLIDNEKYKDLVKTLDEKIGKTKELKLETVGPTVSRDLIKKAVLAVIFALIGIVLYIAWAFRSVPKPLSSWKFGVSAILALVHDVLLVVGIFSILGHFFKVEVDNLFITAVLTVIGFSTHDTIVVFDRIRENLRTSSGNLTDIANKSIAETMNRSLNTSATVFLTLLALLIFGGQSIFWFVLALLVGIVTGTYSSIFNASVIMVLWHRKAKI